MISFLQTLCAKFLRIIVLVDRDFPYGGTFASILSQPLQDHWTPLSRAQKQERARDITIQGFEHVPGLTNEKMRQKIEKRYPEIWLRGSAKEIIYIPERQQGHKEGWEKAATMRQFGIQAMLEQDVRAPIFLYPTSRSPSKELVLEDLDHELAHVNDPENSRMLSAQERIQMFYEMTERYRSPERLQIEYVESIQHEDPQAQLYIRVKEYWAELVSLYFGPERERFQKEHTEDFNLVDRWYKRINE